MRPARLDGRGRGRGSSSSSLSRATRLVLRETVGTLLLASRCADLTAVSTVYKSFDELISEDVLEPVKIKDPKNTIAFLGYSSGTSGKAKGVRTSHYNMTSVLSMLTPFNCTPADVQIAVLPLSRSSFPLLALVRR